MPWYEYECPVCRARDQIITSSSDPSELSPPICSPCDATMRRIPSSFALSLTPNQVKESLKERSRRDNQKNQADRVQKALDRVDGTGVNSHGGIFNPKHQEAASKAAKAKRNK